MKFGLRDRVVLLAPSRTSHKDNRSKNGLLIKSGTVGSVVARRQNGKDPEPCYLVKWNGHGGLRHTNESRLTSELEFAKKGGA